MFKMYYKVFVHESETEAYAVRVSAKDDAEIYNPLQAKMIAEMAQSLTGKDVTIAKITETEVYDFLTRQKMVHRVYEAVPMLV